MTNNQAFTQLLLILLYVLYNKILSNALLDQLQFADT